MKIEEYPDYLTQTRSIIEGNYIFCLYKEPEMIPDFAHIKADISNGDIRTEDGIFYLHLAREMYKMGYKNFDALSIMTFTEDKPILKSGYESRGGQTVIEELKSIIDPTNIDVYYDDLCKSNLLINLYEKGFNVKQDFEKFKLMTSEDVYDYFEFQLSNVSLSTKSKRLEVADLSSDYENFIEEWNEGSAVGMRMGFGLLNYHSMGVHKQNLMLLGAHTNMGKSSIMFNLYVIPAIEDGNDICIISNEMTESQFRQMFLATVMFNITGGGHLNRTKLAAGNYTEDDLVHIKKAIEWIANQKGKVNFIHLFTYDTNVVKKIVKKFSKLGTQIFIYDVLKSEDDASDKAWGALSNVAKDLFLLASQQDVAIIATVQLAQATLNRRFLDNGTIGRSKMIAEVASQIFLFRPLRPEEKEKGNSKFVKIWKYKRDDNGKATNIKEEVLLRQDSDAIVLFISKNRSGRNDICIVYERNLSFNQYKEIGFCEISYDGY